MLRTDRRAKGNVLEFSQCPNKWPKCLVRASPLNLGFSFATENSFFKARI